MVNTYIPIATQKLASSVASITFSSIPQTYTDLILKMSVRTSTASVNSGAINITYNGDSASNYSLTIIAGLNSSQYCNHSYNNTYLPSMELSVASAGNASNTFSAVEMYLSNYTTTSAKPMLLFGGSSNSSSSQNWVSLEADLYRGASAISSITIASTDSYVTGSRFDLYGITHF